MVSRPADWECHSSLYYTLELHLLFFLSLPLVSDGGSHEVDVAERITQVLQCKQQVVLPEQCRRVRNVAPNKEMMCAEFYLDWELLTNDYHVVSDDSNKCKRIKLDTS